MSDEESPEDVDEDVHDADEPVDDADADDERRDVDSGADQADDVGGADAGDRDTGTEDATTGDAGTEDAVDGADGDGSPSRSGTYAGKNRRRGQDQPAAGPVPTGDAADEVGDDQSVATDESTPEEASERPTDDGGPSAATPSGGASQEITRGAGAGEELLTVRDLDAGYGDLQILTEVDMDVADGEYVTIVGPNGAGKSTAMKSIFGLTNVMGGEIVFDDRDITGHNPEEIIHYGLGYVPQSDNVFPGLSVLENLEMGAYILDEVPQERLDAVFERFPILDERREQKAGTLSGGQQQMLAMGRALMLDPDLLMLDEPSAGLAPDLVEDMFDRIDGINDSGTAILMVEQNAKEALRRCDRGYVLVQGQNRFEDSGEALLADEEVRREFLGG